MIYAVRNRTTDRYSEIDADTFEHAVTRAYVTEYGRKRGLYARRETGTPGLSGVFQVYRPLGRSGGHQDTNCGPTAGFHVSVVS